MSTVWQQYEGEVINSRYRVGELLHTEDHTAIFRTEAGQQRAVVHLIHIDPEQSQFYLSRWRQLTRLGNPHILRVLDSGDASTGDDSVLFLVTEEPDDILASVLAERPMTEPETREVAESLADALHCLHRNGLAHGSLSPSTVFAVGNQIKISGDGLKMSEEASAADDVHAFGMTLVACLNQHKPLVEELPDVLADMPEPFKTIATRALDPDPQARWTAARIQSELQGGQLEGRVPGRSRAEDAGIPAPRNTVKYAAITGGIVLLGIIGYEWVKPREAAAPAVATVVERKPEPARPAAPVNPQAVNTPAEKTAPVKQAPAKRATVPPRPEGVRSRVTPVPPPKAAPALPSATGGEHLVIVATYNRMQDAEKRANSITSRWPKFPATVLAPHQPNPPYFVTIGANLSKDEAVRLQKRARAAGLPKDTYVTK